MLQLDVEVAVERKEGVEYFVETEVDYLELLGQEQRKSSNHKYFTHGMIGGIFPVNLRSMAVLCYLYTFERKNSINKNCW